VGYALYASAGTKVFGFLGGYAKEEGIDSGTRFFALDYVHSLHGLQSVPEVAFYLFAAVVLGALSWWGWRYAAVERFEILHPAHDGKAVMNGAPRAVRISCGGYHR